MRVCSTMATCGALPDTRDHSDDGFIEVVVWMLYERGLHETHFGNLLGSFCVPRKTSPKDLPSVCLSCKIKCRSQAAQEKSPPPP